MPDDDIVLSIDKEEEMEEVSPRLEAVLDAVEEELADVVPVETDEDDDDYGGGLGLGDADEDDKEGWGMD